MCEIKIVPHTPRCDKIPRKNVFWGENDPKPPDCDSPQLVGLWIGGCHKYQVDIFKLDTMCEIKIVTHSTLCAKLELVVSKRSKKERTSSPKSTCQWKTVIEVSHIVSDKKM